MDVGPVWEGAQLEDGLCPGVHGQAEQQDTHQVHQEAGPHLQWRPSELSNIDSQSRWKTLAQPTAGSAQLAIPEPATSISTDASQDLGWPLGQVTLPPLRVSRCQAPGYRVAMGYAN